jgi:pyruvate carboxylase subunit A
MISKLIAWGRNRDEAITKMQRALYEYIIAGIKTNIPFHQAVMENERFAKGELGTHFIDSEATLIDDIKRIMEQQKPLQEKLSRLSDDKKKIAAIAAAAMAFKNMSIRENP